MWIDSHCHLNDEAFAADCEEVLERAGAAGVEAMIVVGFDLPSSERAIQLAERHEPLRAAVGIHPHDAKIWDAEVAGRLRQLLGHPRVVALGEIGLDYHYNYSAPEQQRIAFKAQLQLAADCDKPVIIHNREAHQDTLMILTEQPLGAAGGVMHCYSGSLPMAESFLKLGLHISLAGPVTFANAAKLREVAAALPLAKLLVETDSPYLAPHPWRGRRNEPGYVGFVGAKLAEIKELPLAEVMEQTTANTRRLFRL
ncbi:TatD DNase family protein [Hydrogenispora ethanolica]|uniref:TatD DNase family protein n=1 Tax=Hydrogenispora ethanolica TaxID=1082276 RepID=A0A4R1S4B2_HYDET|nr:TatD family hydrolase [Hydrogenispora ethanolica]TCL74093.1 TatD DNase family protein [Hydrogenispora ethanolica]